jgi:telomerase reverse transcriptase
VFIADVSDVLNRHPYHSDGHDLPMAKASAPGRGDGTVRVMMYIFPRQFGLHNVFTHDVDHRETVQPLKDYTLREDEINKKYPLPSAVKIPKRLRGTAVALVRKLQIQHRRCPYKELLEYYCPVSSSYSTLTPCH